MKTSNWRMTAIVMAALFAASPAMYSKVSVFVDIGVPPPPPAPVVVVAAPAPPPPPAPVVVMAAPAPVVVEEYIPDSYIWDGYEYIGVIGDDYYYLGAGNIWYRCEPWREHRFHDWERYNGDWRMRVVINDHYRHGRDGRDHPRGERHGPDRHDRDQRGPERHDRDQRGPNGNQPQQGGPGYPPPPQH